MQKKLLFTVVLAGALATPFVANGQTQMTPDTGGIQSAPVPAPSTIPLAPQARPSDPQLGQAQPPLPGANSFTESQARSRIEAQGYSGVTGLKKDDQSIWRGQAMRNGASVGVALDFKGNVVEQ